MAISASMVDMMLDGWDANLRLISQDTFDAVSRIYWVLGWKSNTSQLEPFAWIASANEPKPVSNENMEWRRPTYFEACLRQSLYESDPEKFFERVEEACSSLVLYRRP